MGLAVVLLLALVALAIAVIMLCGAFGALFKVSRYLWQMLAWYRGGTAEGGHHQPAQSGNQK